MKRYNWNLIGRAVLIYFCWAHLVVTDSDGVSYLNVRSGINSNNKENTQIGEDPVLLLRENEFIYRLTKRIKECNVQSLISGIDDNVEPQSKGPRFDSWAIKVSFERKYHLPGYPDRVQAFKKILFALIYRATYLHDSISYKKEDHIHLGYKVLGPLVRFIEEQDLLATELEGKLIWVIGHWPKGTHLISEEISKSLVEAQYWYDQGELDKAEPFIKKAVLWMPRQPSPQALNLLGNLYAKRGQKEKAIEVFEIIRRLSKVKDRRFAEAYFSLAELYVAGQKWNKAEEVLVSILDLPDLKPTDEAHAHYNLAKYLYIPSGNLEDAREALNIILQLPAGPSWKGKAKRLLREVENQGRKDKQSAQLINNL